MAVAVAVLWQAAVWVELWQATVWVELWQARAWVWLWKATAGHPRPRNERFHCRVPPQAMLLQKRLALLLRHQARLVLLLRLQERLVLLLWL